MTKFDLQPLWQCVLFFSSLGVFSGVTTAVLFEIAARLWSQGSYLIRLLGILFILVVCLSLLLLIFDLFALGRHYLLINLVLFSILSGYFFHFSLTVHQGGAILGRLVRSDQGKFVRKK